MPSYSKVCLDANLIVRMHDPNALEYAQVLGLWERVVENRAEIIAPALLRYEVTNALFRSATGGLMSEAEAIRILRAMDRLPIKFFDSVGLNDVAFDIARALNLKAAYDAHYIALSQREGAELFTVDKRLVAAAQSRYPFVHYVMDL